MQNVQKPKNKKLLPIIELRFRLFLAVSFNFYKIKLRYNYKRVKQKGAELLEHFVPFSECCKDESLKKDHWLLSVAVESNAPVDRPFHFQYFGRPVRVPSTPKL